MKAGEIRNEYLNLVADFEDKYGVYDDMIPGFLFVSCIIALGIQPVTLLLSIPATYFSYKAARKMHKATKEAERIIVQKYDLKEV